MKTDTAKTNTVGESMTRIVDHVYKNDSASDAVRVMIESGHTAVPVVDHHLRCVGILSRKDFTELFFREDQKLAEFFNQEHFEFPNCSSTFVETCSDLSVCDLMTHDVQTVSHDTSLQEACQIMTSKGVHHLPVVDEQEKLVGMFSSLDAIRHIADQHATQFNRTADS